jgi:hypothetical protein
MGGDRVTGAAAVQFCMHAAHLLLPSIAADCIHVHDVCALTVSQCGGFLAWHNMHSL